MIKLVSHGAFVVDIDEAVIQQVLDIYPDEHLLDRKVFRNALESGVLSYADLVKECDVLHLPWQLFLLTEEKLAAEISKINTQRKAKFDLSKVASRSSSFGNSISMRLLDRLIALQQFSNEADIPANLFCGSLKSVNRNHWIPYIIKYFDIDVEKFNRTTKERALSYLISSLEAKSICVSRGVLTNKILPVSTDLQTVYKQSSGFVVQDPSLPYIFLPNEINRDETAGRQIYTLVSLLLLIGLDEHNILVTSDFEARVRGDRLTRQIHGAVAEFLLPFSATDTYKGIVIDSDIRDELATDYNLTPTAVMVTLRERGLVTTQEYVELVSSIPAKPPATDQFFTRPKLTTSIEKFCGKSTSQRIVTALVDGSLPPTRAQYLLFGHIDKPRFHNFRVMNHL